MFDPQHAFSLIVNSILAIAILWMSFRFRSNQTKMCAALYFMQENIMSGRHNRHAAALAMVANGLSRNDRSLAIDCLVVLATVHGNPEALLAIRDHISESDLRRALKDWGNKDSEFYLRGEKIGRNNAKKLLCFYAGTRTVEHLPSPLTDAEYKMLRERFRIFEPLETVQL